MVFLQQGSFCESVHRIHNISFEYSLELVCRVYNNRFQMTLGRYLLLSERRRRRVSILLDVLNPQPFFYTGVWRWRRRHGVEHLTELTWGEVREVIALVSSGELSQLIEAFKLVYKIQYPARVNVYRFYACVKFLTIEVNRVLAQEREELRGEDFVNQGIMEQAGASSLERFSELGVIDFLAGGDILKYEQIESLPYNTVYYTLLYKTMKKNVEARILKIMNR